MKNVLYINCFKNCYECAVMTSTDFFLGTLDGRLRDQHKRAIGVLTLNLDCS